MSSSTDKLPPLCCGERMRPRFQEKQLAREREVVRVWSCRWCDRAMPRPSLVGRRNLPKFVWEAQQR